MICTQKRLRICRLLLVANLAFIWGNSLLPGEVSAAFSGFVKDILSVLFGISEETGASHGLLRKIAHFTEFTCLGMCLSCLAAMRCKERLGKYLLPLAGGFAAACIDETIQLFVPGRGPGMVDVGIDTLGVALGIIIIFLIQILKREHNLEENKT